MYLKMEFIFGRIHTQNGLNKFEEKIEMKKRLLFICAGGLDRSPCAESLFKNHSKFEAESVGLYPLISSAVVKRHHLQNADYIFVMEYQHKIDLKQMFPLILKDKPEIIVLGVDNKFVRHDPELERLLKRKLGDWLE